MDYVDAATTNILSPDIVHVEDLRNMLRHIESAATFNNPLIYSIQMTPFISTGISTHACINSSRTVPASSSMCPYKTEHKSFKYMKFSVYPVPHSNLSALYKINHNYIRVTYDKTKVVAITGSTVHSLSTCQHGQFCRINAPFQPLTNPPSCNNSPTY